MGEPVGTRAAWLAYRMQRDGDEVSWPPHRYPWRRRDLIFPHHTCEIAQSENATGERPFVQIWMHCGMVYLGERR